MNNPIRNGAMIAIAAASLFAAACKKDEAKSGGDNMMGDKMAKVHCKGVNECKGHGACKSEANACSGQNGCKGQGFVEMNEKDCKDKGGSVMAMEMKK